MAGKDRKEAGRPETGFRRVGIGGSVDVEKFLRRAPQFGTLAKAVGGAESEVSASQLKFLEDFAAELGKGLGEDGDRS